MLLKLMEIRMITANDNMLDEMYEEMEKLFKQKQGNKVLKNLRQLVKQKGGKKVLGKFLNLCHLIVSLKLISI